MRDKYLLVLNSRWLIIVILIISILISVSSVGSGENTNAEIIVESIENSPESNRKNSLDLDPSIKTLANSIYISTQEINPGATEVMKMRTINSKHFDNWDGSYTSFFTLGPIHYRDSFGKWQDICTTITNYSNGGNFACESNGLKVYFPEDYTSNEGIKVDLDGNSWFVWEPKEMLYSTTDGKKYYIDSNHNTKGKIDQNTIIYEGTYSNTTDRFIVLTNEVKHDIILLGLPINLTIYDENTMECTPKSRQIVKLTSLLGETHEKKTQNIQKGVQD